MYRGSNFSTPLQTLIIVHPFDHSHPNKCEVVSRCGFYFRFPNDEWLFIISTHVLPDHFFTFFGEISTQILLF